MESRWDYETPPAGFDAVPDDRFFDTDREYALHQPWNGGGRVVVKQEPKEPKEVRIKAEPVTPAPMSRAYRRRSMSVHIMQSATDETDACGRPPIRCINDTDANKSRMANHVAEAILYKSSSKTSSVTSLNSKADKYVTDAERIYHLQKDTPERFHTRSRNHIHRFFATKPQGLTVPHSPALLSKTRTRPVTALSRRQLEELELRDLKKYKIKANPIPDSVVFGIANLAPVQRRPTTKPEPFRLTQTKNRPPPPAERVKPFSARPVPKNIFERRPATERKAPPPLTVPKSPNIRKPKTRSLENVLGPARMDEAARREAASVGQAKVGHVGVPPTPKHDAKPMKPAPFSFEQRDKERERRKMEKIQKFLDEERALREFHANPIPKAVLKKHSSASSDSKRDHNKENEAKPNGFKAKPPVVLYKPPFVPSRPDRPLLELHQMELTTEKRAKERDHFNQKIREKEEEREHLRRLNEEKERADEERRIALLRTQTVHKAAPVKRYNPLQVHPSEVPLTNPKSPTFVHRKGL